MMHSTSLQQAFWKPASDVSDGYPPLLNHQLPSVDRQRPSHSPDYNPEPCLMGQNLGLVGLGSSRGLGLVNKRRTLIACLKPALKSCQQSPFYPQLHTDEVNSIFRARATARAPLSLKAPVTCKGERLRWVCTGASFVARECAGRCWIPIRLQCVLDYAESWALYWITLSRGL